MVVIVAFGWLFMPVTLRSEKHPDLWPALENARHIGFGLFDFETEYGAFPGPETIAEVKRRTGTSLPLGASTSNDYLRQLLAARLVSDETVFYAKWAGSPKGAKRKEVEAVLGKRECGFAYLGLGQGAAGNSGRPLLVAPLISGTDRFDPKALGGKAVVLRMDRSVTSHVIREDGRVMVGGMNLLDPRHPLWGDHPPVIVWPDL